MRKGHRRGGRTSTHLVVEHHDLVGVLDELVHGERRVVRLHDRVGYLRAGADGERHHDAVGVLLADLGDEQRAHARAGAAAERVRDLEALQAVRRLRLLADDVQHRVDELRALGVVALGPVVARARLAEDEVVGAEELAEGAGADAVHRARLEVHEHGAGHVAAARRLVKVDVDALQLQVRVAVEGAWRQRRRGEGGGQSTVWRGHARIVRRDAARL